ncbi:hypothetical protein ANCCAN_26947 [Ancylostoma caninum]|uniref:Uncharacterized protein n=1 Tax=Ancylostoma caninum TaxID=29170 RepID=A0A368F8F7_ANCCA|nr:hypothetical protein ANCCAN_26947 [Ancylostoma caninum]
MEEPGSLRKEYEKPQEQPVCKPVEEEQLHTAKKPEEIQEIVLRQPEPPLHTAKELEKPKLIQVEPILHTAKEPEKPRRRREIAKETRTVETHVVERVIQVGYS